MTPDTDAREPRLHAVTRKRLLFWSPLALALVLALAWLFRTPPVPVDFAAVERGALQVSVTDEGETRVKEVYVVSAPVAGVIQRIDLEAGDPVVAATTIVARIRPSAPSFLDVRTETEARAAIRAAEAARAHASASVQSAEAELEFARAELTRFRGLAANATISQNALDDARRRERRASAALAEAKAQLAMRENELDRARAALLAPGAAERGASDECDCVSVYAPVSGAVLRVLTKSEGVVAASTPLVEVGDPAELEIVVDLLSADAVQVAPGQRVYVEGWGEPEPLNGVVQRVEPLGFTKISALGIEEQRVNVVIDLTDPPERWRRLGHGYRVEPRIVLWEAEDVAKIPLPALFRDGERWAVFVEEAGRATLRHVEVGRDNGLEAQITDGLAVGERVVLHPGDRVAEGAPLAARR
jgi:HlyD family secretion protein